MRARTINESISITDNDRNLIETAQDISSMDYLVVYEMAEEADSEETREILITLAKNLRQSDEYYSDKGHGDFDDERNYDEDFEEDSE